MIVDVFKIIRDDYDINSLNEKQAYLASLLDENLEQEYDNPFSELEKLSLAQELIDLGREDLLNELVGPSFKVFIYLLKTKDIYLEDCVRFWKEFYDAKTIMSNIIEEVPALPSKEIVFYDKKLHKIKFLNEYFDLLWSYLNLPFTLDETLQEYLENIDNEKLKLSFNLKELVLETKTSYKVKGLSKSQYVLKEGSTKIFQSSIGFITALEPIAGGIANGMDISSKLMDLPKTQEELFLELTKESRNPQTVRLNYEKYLIKHVNKKLYNSYKIIIDMAESFRSFEYDLKSFYLKDLNEKEKQLLSYYRQEDSLSSEYRFIRVKIQDEVLSEHLYYTKKKGSI